MKIHVFSHVISQRISKCAPENILSIKYHSRAESNFFSSFTSQEWFDYRFSHVLVMLNRLRKGIKQVCIRNYVISHLSVLRLPSLFTSHFALRFNRMINWELNQNAYFLFLSFSVLNILFRLSYLTCLRIKCLYIYNDDGVSVNIPVAETGSSILEMCFSSQTVEVGLKVPTNLATI